MPAGIGILILPFNWQIAVRPIQPYHHRPDLIYQFGPICIIIATA